MAVPQVVIVGRPNVGKSSILNWLAGERLSVVDAKAGVTRDRVTSLVQIGKRYVELVDTGGIGIVDADNLSEHVERQIEIALHTADVLLFVVDTKTGVTPLDEQVAQKLRRLKCPILCVANKTDAPSWDPAAAEFERFGWPVVGVSAQQRRGEYELLQEIVERLPPVDDEAAPEDPVMKVAIVGRRNAGKSTFINTLAQEERMIVSEVPGTTRDSVDVRFELDGVPLIAIDTPGLRRRKSIQDSAEFYSMQRAERSIRRADVVLHFFDASQEISRVDKQLATMVHKQFKPCIFVVNKWDLVADKADTIDWADYLHDTFRNMRHAPVAIITGKTGKNVKRLINHAQMLFKQARSRMATGPLNRAVREALRRNPPPLYYHRRVKIYYTVQVAVAPPTLVFFCNNADAISPTYQRYLANFLRDFVPYPEVPIRMFFRKRDSESGYRKDRSLEELDEAEVDAIGEE
ncbi:ribosome biogenesis GTPase Der [Thermostilla marina]